MSDVVQWIQEENDTTQAMMDLTDTYGKSYQAEEGVPGMTTPNPLTKKEYAKERFLDIIRGDVYQYKHDERQKGIQSGLEADKAEADTIT